METNLKGAILIADSTFGIYAPMRAICDARLAQAAGSERVAAIEAGPYRDEYWDTWDEITRDVRVAIDGNEYFVLEENDVWLVPVE